MGLDTHIKGVELISFGLCKSSLQITVAYDELHWCFKH